MGSIYRYYFFVQYSKCVTYVSKNVITVYDTYVTVVLYGRVECNISRKSPQEFENISEERHGKIRYTYFVTFIREKCNSLLHVSDSVI